MVLVGEVIKFELDGFVLIFVDVLFSAEADRDLVIADDRIVGCRADHDDGERRLR